MRKRLKTAASAVALTALFTLTACGGGDIASSAAAAGGSKSCGTFNVAVNPWVGYEADAYVVGTLAKEKLGCTVNYKTLKEEVAWQGFGSGDVDVVLENWGHPDLKQKYIDQDKTAVEVGPTGNTGQIGWFVPPWMAQKYPDITDWKNLNKYASL
ncbi:glycine betaine ABC transporter substrate-binding protein, partial [Sinomonas sp.]|uniref:glycine betaine ABC transporter substrate-binding protein n=1 Tax=Sinomonas sp. TaxID=1914986 RepID=UPI002FE23922